MVLKIKHFNQWTIYDRIKKFDWSSIKIKDDTIVRETGWHDNLEEDTYSAFFTCFPLEGKSLIEAQFKTDTGGELKILFETAYLCNDQGKTIEKLVA